MKINESKMKINAEVFVMVKREEIIVEQHQRQLKLLALLPDIKVLEIDSRR